MEARELFGKIGTGKEQAVGRPADPYLDRALRRLIEKANREGDCIISGKRGYYRPDICRPEEEQEAEHVIAAELHRARAILQKRLEMKKALKEWRETKCLSTVCKKEPEEKESSRESPWDMITEAEGDSSNIPGQMVIRM